MARIAAIIGGGVIGGGWAARFLLTGWDVRVFDPDPEAERKIGDVLAHARRALPGLYDVALPPEGALSFHHRIPDAVAGAEWIQESVPERLDLKRKLYLTLQEHCDAAAIIGSSTSGFKPSDLQAGATRPGQIVVAHPFNPVYLLPLVELVTSDRTPPERVDRAAGLLRGIGLFPLHLHREIDAHIADRLLESVWREALWLVRDGIATTGEIDDAIRMGFGLRWAQMGLFETYRMAGGEAGMRHFLSQFGPALGWPWSRLTDVPEMSEALVETIAAQSDAQSGAHGTEDLARIRDINLVAILRALKAQNWGAGAHLQAEDRRISAENGMVRRFDQIGDLSAPIVTFDRAVPLDWAGASGEMDEARYLQAFVAATGRFTEILGFAADDETKGGYVAAESRIRHLGAIHPGRRVRIETLCLDGAGARLHLFHRMLEGTALRATGEHVLTHRDGETGRPAPPPEPVAGRLAEFARAHAARPRPEGAAPSADQPR